MPEQPILETERLILRPYVPGDAPDVQHLAGAWEVASTMLNMPHPYEDGMAEAWIASQREHFASGRQANWAVTLRAGGALAGGIGLRIEPEHERAELGYWIGVPYWGQGLCTEAARAVLRYGFVERDLHRIGATHRVRNPASGRVMHKIGLTREGTLRDFDKRWGRFEDLVWYGLLREEWEARNA